MCMTDKRNRNNVLNIHVACVRNECTNDCVACGRCNKWFHLICIGMQGDQHELENGYLFLNNCVVSMS